MLCLSACGSFQTSDVTTLAQVKLADTLIQSGVVDDAVLSADLNDIELQVYIDALDTYRAFRSAWESPTPDMYLLLDSQYSQLYGAYKSVENIVIANWDEYPAHVQAELKRYHQQAIAIHTGAVKALEAKNKQEALNEALQQV